MGFNSKINQKADEILNNKRLEALHNQDRMRSIVYSQFPRLQEIEQQLIIIGSETAKAVLNGGSAVEMTKKLAKESLALQSEARDILVSHGYKEDALEPHFSCTKCNDTGRYDDEKGRTVLCDCLKKIRIDVACDELNKSSPLELSSFDNFSLDYYDMVSYLGNKYGYGWHISDLKIYDKPKELSEFKIGRKGCKERDTYHCKFYCYGERPITRPPQSWMFVKEL